MFSSPLPTQEGTGCWVMTTDRIMLTFSVTFDTGFYSFLQKLFGCNFFNKSPPPPHFACAEYVMCIEPEKLFSLEGQLASVIVKTFICFIPGIFVF